MHAWQHLKHDQRQQKHGKQTHETCDITVAKFKDTQTPKGPLRVGHVHPNQTCISEQVEHVDGGQNQQQSPYSFFPREVQDGDGSDEEHHRLDGRAGEDEINANGFTVGEQKFGLKGVFAGEIGRKPSVSIPILPGNPSAGVVDPGGADLDICSCCEAEEHG